MLFYAWLNIYSKLERIFNDELSNLYIIMYGREILSYLPPFSFYNKIL